MRYSKGSVVFNPARDLPLLRCVLDSRFVTHSQLYRFMRRSAAEFDRQVFNWRVRRLRRHGLIHARMVPFLAAEPIYSITPSGVLALESRGELPFTAWAGGERSASQSQIPHALELNNIELALRDGGPVVLWTPENRVRCLYTYLPGTYAKVYDAVVEVRIGDRSLTLALEYEATQKTFARYDKILREIEAERRIDVILYAASTWELMAALVSQFCGARRPVLFTLLKSLKEKRWDAETFDTRWASRPLAGMLQARASRTP